MEDILLYVFLSSMSIFMVVNGTIKAKEEFQLQFQEAYRIDKQTSTEEDDHPGIEFVEEPVILAPKPKYCNVM